MALGIANSPVFGGAAKWDLATLQPWLQLDSTKNLTSSGGYVSSWLDSAGSGRGFTNGGSTSSKPILQENEIGAIPALYTSAAGRYLTFNGSKADVRFLNDGSPFSLVYVWKQGATSPGGGLFSNNGTGYGFGINRGTSGKEAIYLNGGSLQGTASSLVPAGYNANVVRWDYNAGQNLQLWRNGALEIDKSVAAGDIENSDANYNLQLFAINSGQSLTQIYLVFFAIIKARLTDIELTKSGVWLKNKYGITW